MTSVESDRADQEAFSSSVVLEQTAAAPESLLASPDQLSQAEITQEIIDYHAAADAREAAGERVGMTLHDYPPYRSSILRHPTKNPKLVDPETIELWSPAFGQRDVAAIESDLTLQHTGEPQGERMTVQGRLLDSWGRPLANQLIELWQANAAGRYIHQRDQHPAPLDPNFTGAGRVVTNDNGEYKFTTIKPGAYPWKNHVNAWRPAHIHFSVFGPAFATRLVTQMYFPGDPLLPHDPIFNCTADPRARQRLVSEFDFESTVEGHALGFRFDVVLSGPEATPMEAPAG